MLKALGIATAKQIGYNRAIVKRLSGYNIQTSINTELDNLVEDDNLNIDNILISSIFNEKVIKKDAQGNVKYSLDNDGYPIKSDKQVISDSPFIKKDAKDLILESIDNGSISIIDVEELLFEYAGQLIIKRNVKEFIDRRR